MIMGSWSLHQEGKLIPEQYPGELNPLFQMAIHPSHTAWKDQPAARTLIQPACT